MPIAKPSTPVFTPQQVATVCGVSQDTQRDWRRRDLMEFVGVKNEKGRWLYSLDNMLSLILVKSFIERGIDLNLAFKFALNSQSEINLNIINIVTGRTPHRMPKRYISFAYNEASKSKSEMSAWDSYLFNSLDELPLVGPIIFFVVDIRSFFDGLPENFKGLMGIAINEMFKSRESDIE